MRIHGVLVALALVAAGTGGCKRDKASNDNTATPPPPPPPQAKAASCSSGGGNANDTVQGDLFPRIIGAYCIDPQGDTRTYGDKGKLSMDEVCTTAFDGECEVYKSFGLKRVVALRYVDGNGGGGTVEVNLSTFADTNGGYAMFTKRVVADADPSGPTAPRALAGAGGAAALGSGRGYVWKGPLLAELTYINEQEPPEQMIKSSDPVLSAIARDIGAKMPGSSDLPDSAMALPLAERIVNGIEFHPKDVLGFSGAGPAAVGFYKDKDSAKRFRFLAIVRADAEQAKDSFKILRGKPGALPVSGLADDAAVIVTQSSPESVKVEYVVARKGALVAGVGDEEFVLKAGEPLAKQADQRLSKDEKITRLRAWLATVNANAPLSPGTPTPASSAATTPRAASSH